MMLRAYGLQVGDFQLLDSWWQARHRTPFPENQVPPLGVICEIDGVPMGALFAYQSAGIGISFLEMGVTRPGTSLALARVIMQTLLRGICDCLRASGYGILRLFCETPVMERAAKMLGFTGKNGNLWLMI